MKWDEEVDWLVVGSGAAGMTSALRAADLGVRTLVIEKSTCFGGSTAMSGGAIWVPANPGMAALGIRDSRDEGLRYLEHIVAGRVPGPRLAAYVDAAPRMVEYLAARSHVAFEPVPTYSDYYAEAPGGKPGARTIEPPEFEAMQLGAERTRQRLGFEHSRPLPFMSIKASDVPALLLGGPQRLALVARRAAAYYLNLSARLAGAGNTCYTLGASLVARLRLSLVDRDVPLWLDSPLHELVLEDGRVTGAVVGHDGRSVRVRVVRGVLLAAGGFEKNAAMRQRYQEMPIGADWAAGCPDNEGDAIRIAEEAGAALDLMDQAWWCPVFKVPGDPNPRVIVMEKGMPGSMLVDRAGRRFVNESSSYNDFVKGMYAAHRSGTPAIPAQLVFDATFRRRYPVGPVRPGSIQPDAALPASIRDGFLVRAESLAELARAIDVDPAGLAASVARFNGFARSGRDQDFGRGETISDRYYSDPQVTPNPCLAPIEKPPFYAVKVYPGDLGTKGGVVTDPQGRALDTAGRPIPGMYAAGNCSASMMGETYPGAGGTIGPAMVFGFLAAEHACDGARHPGAT
ncbi:MAG: FAD-binding protein [Gammaproteobacteria bacterium]|nr:FAD-binding protein [Gammaproteobacteria bacterium]